MTLGSGPPEREPGSAGEPAVGGLLPLLEEDRALAVAAEARVPEVLARLHVFRLLLGRPSLAKGLSGLLLALLTSEVLPARLRELQILRVAWRRGSAYEWSQHWRIAADLGIPPAVLLAVREGPGAPGLDPEDHLVLQAADEVLTDGQVTARTLADLVGALGEGGALEAVAVPAVWAMVAVILQSAQVPLEEGLPPWLPDGRGPRWPEHDQAPPATTINRSINQ
ncbi:carboxymuconolactone decarboxylase family protein [Aciditerrimonas ferrireducens]|jgi:alkylhydroperoxidase family enzyme|uniref:Carboxymuconolactone decarboxylase family protein n=1 Tax=Aciditerrimonas ferrireducens TaxID=667306 RepID=A0ABV6C180_9ACTN